MVMIADNINGTLASSETMEQELARVAAERGIARSPVAFDPMMFVEDNRILPQHVAFQDKLNENVWLHPADLTVEREAFLRQKLESAFSIEYPPYVDEKVRNIFIEALRAAVPKDPSLSSVISESAKPKPLETDLFQYPLSHMVNGEPFAPLISEADLKQYRDAIAIYLALEFVLAEKGYPEILSKAVSSLEGRGVEKPTIDQLFNELRSALDISTSDMARALHSGGVDGVNELLLVSPDLSKEIDRLMDYLTPRGFPLNDVINWMYGRNEPNMQGASTEEMVTIGLQARIDQTIHQYRSTVKQFTAMPEEIADERLVAAAMNHVPPIISELFFEEGGVVIFTPAPDLMDVLGMPATGFHITYESPQNPAHSMHQIFISQELGLPKNTRTLVHEMNHMMYPELITPESAVKADELLIRDQQRIKYLKSLVDQYSTGDAEIQQKALEWLNKPEFRVNGQSFSEMVTDGSMLTFIGAVNEAYHYLQMESPTYNRIGTYSEPLDRFREMLPRYAELRYVGHSDNPNMLKFIVPGITEIYDDLYLPHLEQRLQHLRATQPSKVDALMASIDPSEIYTKQFQNPEHSEGWTEWFGGVEVRHPKPKYDGKDANKLNDASAQDYFNEIVASDLSHLSARASSAAALSEGAIRAQANDFTPLPESTNFSDASARGDELPISNTPPIPLSARANNIVPLTRTLTILSDGRVANPLHMTHSPS
jgi:hypothetical protein